MKRLMGPETLAERLWSKVHKTEGCWNWTGAQEHGRGRIASGTGRVLRPSRVSWELQNGPIQNGLFVLHKCDNPRCVRPDHLFLGTQKDNMHDMVSKGRKHTALTAEQVLRIRAAWPAQSKNQIAKQFGVTKSCVSHVVKGRAWRHV